ncbi:MAG: M56 family metallopeptidase [Steroidobacteraceae bacterium]
MVSERILYALIEANLAASAAIVLMLVVRPIMGRIFGARAVYRLWLIVPITALAISLPTPQPETRTIDAHTALVGEQFATGAGDSLSALLSAKTHSAMATVTTWAVNTRSEVRSTAYESSPLLFALWMAGALLLLARAFILSDKLAADPLLGPALVGVLRPRLVLPNDFTTRFDAREQQLILAHESMHRAAKHTLINALVEFGRCVNWVNPLAHVAAFYARADQELSCDAAVMAQFPGERQAYAHALLKAQTTIAIPPLGCAWPGRSSTLLRQRIEMLAYRKPGRWRSAAALLVIATLMGGSGYVAWAAQPADPGAGAALDKARPPTAAPAQPPAGLLTELDKKRHALFVRQAEAGNIDVVFIGDSVVDFWRYDNSGNPEWNTHSGGKAEWNRSYVPLKAANFGVEGAHTRSVLWRLQNGELDNIQPKVVVLVALGIADAANHKIELPQIISGNKAIIAEIRQRQPQARILLIALPRGQLTNLSRQVMAPVNNALAKFADDRRIYFLDLRGRFLAADGTLDSMLYTDDLGQVLSPKGYVAWSQAMQPMLAKLMR